MAKGGGGGRGGGGVYKTVGGAKSSFTPTKKKGGGGVARAEHVLDMVKGGTQRFEVVLIQVLEIMVILKGNVKRFHHLEGGREKFYRN